MRTAGRIRMEVIPGFAGATMRDFVTWNITADTTIYTDGLKSFEGLTGAGYEHVEAPRATSRFGIGRDRKLLGRAETTRQVRATIDRIPQTTAPRRNPRPAPRLFAVERAQPLGHVEAVLGSIRKQGLDGLIASKPSRERDLVVAMIAERVLVPSSKLATTRVGEPQLPGRGARGW